MHNKEDVVKLLNQLLVTLKEAREKGHATLHFFLDENDQIAIRRVKMLRENEKVRCS